MGLLELSAEVSPSEIPPPASSSNLEVVVKSFELDLGDAGSRLTSGNKSSESLVSADIADRLDRGDDVDDKMSDESELESKVIWTVPILSSNSCETFKDN